MSTTTLNGTETTVDVAETDSVQAKPHKPTSEEIYEVAADYYEFIRDTYTGELYAYSRETGLCEPLVSRGAFAARVVRLAQLKHGRIPRSQAVAEAITAMQGEAANAPSRPIHLRVANKDGVTWLDTGGDKLILVNAGGYTTAPVTDGFMLFRRTPVMEELPEPEEGMFDWMPGVGRLWEIVNVQGPYRLLLLGWIVHCIIHEIDDFPILLIQAEQGSGKSFLLRILSRLIDPSKDNGGSLPQNEDALAVSALNTRLLLFDNISRIPPQKSDLLCRVATGGTVRRRKLYTDAAEGVYSIRRPVIITGINLGTMNNDLAERIVKIELKRPLDSQRKALADLEDKWKATQGEIFGALLLLAAQVQDVLEQGRVDGVEVPRMTGYGRVLAAIDLLTSQREDMPATHCLNDYRDQQKGMSLEMVSDEPVWLALDQNRSMFTVKLEDVTSNELLRKLQGTFRLEPQELGTWKKPPQSAADLTRDIDKCAPSLRQAGWNITYRLGTGNRSGQRLWTIQAPRQEGIE
ncbi:MULTISPECIES: hypothetical protein [unclassified Bifidobacterium]|uniref:hypothetical protein n=1 Tax=unclassified Bifidobacterium TaxID=2608897 RepID=UPI0011285632|nr:MULTISPECIES: hypothetical protein [unclassified Bifidobacterium]TPF84350.1 hypothetical protein BW07_05130 [Bifidobacterium sp. UTCIF-36]TPF91033.1 hypothetical protein BW10_02105 [Bifidobacterium sp. UTBIF-56]